MAFSFVPVKGESFQQTAHATWRVLSGSLAAAFLLWPQCGRGKASPHVLAWGSQCLHATFGRNMNLLHILGMFKKHIWLLIAAEPFGTPTFPVFYGLPTLTGEQIFKLTAYGQEMGFKISFILYFSVSPMLWASTLTLLSTITLWGRLVLSYIFD